MPEARLTVAAKHLGKSYKKVHLGQQDRRGFFFTRITTTGTTGQLAWLEREWKEPERSLRSEGEGGFCKGQQQTLRYMDCGRRRDAVSKSRVVMMLNGTARDHRSGQSNKA